MTEDEAFAEHAEFWEATEVNAAAARAFLGTRGKLSDKVLLRALNALRADVHETSWPIQS